MIVPTRISGPLDILAPWRPARRRSGGAIPCAAYAFPDHRKGKPAPRIEPPQPEVLPVIDLRMPSRRRNGRSRIRRLSRAEALRSFDLARGPLLRLLLFRLAPDDISLLLGAHHIVVDP